MFIRVKHRVTGHEFDIHESRFDEEKHIKVDKRRYPPVREPRKTKFKARIPRAVSVSTEVEEGDKS